MKTGLLTHIFQDSQKENMDGRVDSNYSIVILILSILVLNCVQLLWDKLEWVC